MVDQYQTAVQDILEDTKSQLQTSFARNEFQYLIDYFFTAKELSAEQLRVEVDNFHNSQKGYSRLFVRLGVKKIPPRIRAFEQELSDRLCVDCMN